VIFSSKLAFIYMRLEAGRKARAVAVALSGRIARHCGNQGSRRQDVARATVQPGSSGD